MDSMFSIKNLVDRWKAEMPKFWKQVLYFMATVSAVGLSVQGYAAAMETELPLWLMEFSKQSIAIGVVGMILAKLTKTDYPNING